MDDEKVEHDAHIRRKQQAKDSKAADKVDSSKLVAAFDLQQVLTCPKLSVSSAYYSRKLNLYNFTILNLQTLQGNCFTWSEYECRGTNDIASAVWMWLSDMEGAKHVVFYSDCCGGQNRNRIMISAMLKLLCDCKNITTIEHKYFESGHSKNECDNMHSTIQARYAHRDVFLPSAYHEHMKLAQHTKPYKVSVLDHNDIFDFCKLNNDTMKKNAFTGIQKVHHIKFQKEEGLVSVSFADEIDGDFVLNPFFKRGKTQSRLRVYDLSKANHASCGIDDNKREDLRKLAQFLPVDCRPFYFSF